MAARTGAGLGGCGGRLGEELGKGVFGDIGGYVTAGVCYVGEVC